MTDGVSRVSLEVGGTEISFETGKLAKQASGSVVVRAGDTMVLSTATAGNVRDVDFLPLTVDVEERMYATGKIPGSFFRREARAGEKATLTARMIDRPLRPLFPKGWNRETQLVSIPMSVDHVNPYDILAMNGASAALMISDIPFPAPVGAVRIGQDSEGSFVVNPDEEWLLESPLDLVVAGTEEAILMVEAGASEITEAEILDALDIAHAEIKRLCEAQHDLRKQAGKDKIEHTAPAVDESLSSELKERFGPSLDEATQVVDKLERQDATKRVEEESLESLAGDADDAERRAAVQRAFDTLEKDIIRKRIAVDKKRPDGRAADELRDIWIEVGVAPRTHGSAIFTRGQTQAFSVAALGTTRDEMRLDTLGLQEKKHYFHHYNFPPFSVGRGGLHARTQAPRHRTRSARRARARAGRADGGRVPVHDSRGLGHPRVERLVVHGLRLRLDAVADGRRRADQGAGGRHRDGPDQGGRRLRRAHRHRGRGGPPGRHGLQGRRNVRGHHRAPDGHQDLGRHVRHPARRAHAGPERPARDPRQDEGRDRRAARRAVVLRAAHLADPDRHREDRRRHRQGRRDHPRALRGVRGADRHRRRRDRSASTRPPASRATP